ncbi:hypothetical protein CLOSCI_03712 [[Clostridium] scindens ATCC 35704]|nr:hypothetical protein CLOSCI_03712 [[Clostridium] scindens ATCC 35704]
MSQSTGFAWRKTSFFLFSFMHILITSFFFQKKYLLEFSVAQS